MLSKIAERKYIYIMKQHIKKMIEFLFGTQKNLTFKIGLSSFISSLIFIFLSDIFQENSAVYSIFKFAAAVFIVLFILSIIKSNTATNFFIEAVRFLAYTGIYGFSFKYLVNILSYSGFSLYFYTFLCCIGIFACSFYLISKFNDIFDFFKNIFIILKTKLFSSFDPSISKVTQLLTNLTAFLAAISALAITIQTMTEMVKNMFDLFK